MLSQGVRAVVTCAQCTSRANKKPAMARGIRRQGDFVECGGPTTEEKQVAISDLPFGFSAPRRITGPETFHQTAGTTT
jgi:hypothetical protein